MSAGCEQMPRHGMSRSVWSAGSLLPFLGGHWASDSASKLDALQTLRAIRLRLCRAIRQEILSGAQPHLLICAIAVRRRMRIFTTDTDFNEFAKHLIGRLRRKGRPELERLKRRLEQVNTKNHNAEVEA